MGALVLSCSVLLLDEPQHSPIHYGSAARCGPMAEGAGSPRAGDAEAQQPPAPAKSQEQHREGACCRYGPSEPPPLAAATLLGKSG
jgi:hypothetical protein